MFYLLYGTTSGSPVFRTLKNSYHRRSRLTSSPLCLKSVVWSVLQRRWYWCLPYWAEARVILGNKQASLCSGQREGWSRFKHLCTHSHFLSLSKKTKGSRFCLYPNSTRGECPLVTDPPLLTPHDKNHLNFTPGQLWKKYLSGALIEECCSIYGFVFLLNLSWPLPFPESKSLD